MDDFQRVNKIYAKYFKGDPPARSCIGVKELPRKGKVEIELITL